MPSGLARAIDYAHDAPPVLAVKLQELFGLADTPRIAEGRVPLTLHLLSPGGKPLQVTQDLRGFWDRTYPEVRKEMKGRYPRHPWPDDPWTATRHPPRQTTRHVGAKNLERVHPDCASVVFPDCDPAVPTCLEIAMKTEKMISTGLTLVRDAGSAAVEAVSSKVGTGMTAVVPVAKSLAKQVKGAVSVGAGIALAKKGGKMAMKAARKNPVAVAAGAVALAGLGVAVAVVRKRKKDREAAAAAGIAKPKRVAARDMRSNGAATTTTAAKKAPAKRAPRARKPAGSSTH